MLAARQFHNLETAQMSAGGFHDSPQSQRPLVVPGPGWLSAEREGDSPAVPPGEKVHFSPYTSQYSSPVSASDQVHMVGMEWPLPRKGSTSGVPLGRRSSIDKRGLDEEDGDRIEMQNVAPALLHPGAGKMGFTKEYDPRGVHQI